MISSFIILIIVSLALLLFGIGWSEDALTAIGAITAFVFSVLLISVLVYKHTVKVFKNILLTGFALSLLSGGLLSLVLSLSNCSGESCLGRDLGIYLVGPAIVILGTIFSLIIAIIAKRKNASEPAK